MHVTGKFSVTLVLVFSWALIMWVSVSCQTGNVTSLPASPTTNLVTTTSPIVEEGTKIENVFSYDRFLQDIGILYVRSEYHQAQMGLSLVQGGGEFSPLTTTYEWWLDVEDPLRLRRVTTEWLDDGPHIVAADGADGETWWEVDWTRQITTPVYYKGTPPFAFPDVHAFIQLFSREGESLVGQQSQTTQVEQIEQSPWGELLIIRQQQPETGQLITATIRAEAPFVLVEKVVTDGQGNLFQTMRLTDWQWLDPADLPADFWLKPPADVPIAP